MVAPRGVWGRAGWQGSLVRLEGARAEGLGSAEGTRLHLCTLPGRWM